MVKTTASPLGNHSPPTTAAAAELKQQLDEENRCVQVRKFFEQDQRHPVSLIPDRTAGCHRRTLHDTVTAVVILFVKDSAAGRIERWLFGRECLLAHSYQNYWKKETGKNWN